ncbi:MAG TPA: 3-hydroxy-3-methylglutaryl-CoA reductase, partial [Thermoanaerobaculia bacterium]|nr:3-hydroxy-3-methylglutaryl-CoA reductase [Thermoanaerobaculia bacterium]
MSKMNPLASASAPLTRDDLVRSLVEGERRFHELPKDLPAAEAAEIRRLALGEMTQTPLSNIGHHSLDVHRAAHRNCENFIGVAQIPMGVVGPLRVRGKHVDDEEVYVPLATTEAALVASTNRGCAAVREAGGVVVRVEDVGMTRAPVFRTSGIVQTQQFLQWINDHEDELRRLTESTSRYLKLLEVRPYAFGTTVFLRFR